MGSPKDRSSRRAGLIAIASLLAGAVVFEGGPDPVIYPPQQIPIVFTHDYHVRSGDPATGARGEGLACDFCHDQVATSTLSADRNIPGHGGCDGCHADWIGDESAPAPIEQCGRCHRDLAEARGGRAAPMVIPPPNLIFPHKDHVEAGVKCRDCHGDVPEKRIATREDYPTMDRCIACHEEREVSTACTTCHLSLPSGRIVDRYPEGELMPRRYHAFAIHDADFLRDHGVPARRDKPYCMSCHGESDCLECHDGLGRDVRYHPGDWLSMHHLRSKKDDLQCQSCHRHQTFCLDCHVRSGVASVGPVTSVFESTRLTIRRDPTTQVPTGPHPMSDHGWLDPASRNFHGFHAQRNIRSCASCHQEQYCLRCHRSAFPAAGAAIGGNPHGPNPERLKGSTARLHNARMCLKCHSPFDPRWR